MTVDTATVPQPTPAALAGGTRAVMIDRPGTPDRDDGIWVTPVPGGGWRASVHIADVARHIHEGSRADGEAFTRGWTKYLPDRTIGMLPRRTEEAATLADGAHTCLITLGIAADGAIEDTTVARSRLHHAIAMDYEQAATLRTGPIGGMLAAAHDLARVRLARRRDDGALALYDLIRGVATTEEGHLVRLDDPERNAGYVIVAELMIAANEALARWAATRDLPILYRNHRAAAVAPPRAELLAGMVVDQASLEQARERLAVIIKTAEYGPQVTGHYGLNAAYTHATSPLRRYADLVTQRMVLAAVDGRPAPYSAAQAAEIAAELNGRAAERRRRISARMKDAAKAKARADAEAGAFTGLDDDKFHKALKIAVRENRRSPALEAETCRRADAGRLAPRDLHLLLCTADSTWRTAQTAARACVAAAPHTAPSVLAIHTADAPPVWDIALLQDSPPRYRAQVSLTGQPGSGSAARGAPSKREARQQAALSLLCRIAGLDDVSADIANPAPARRAPRADPAAISSLNTHVQAGAITGLTWSYTAEGPDHARVFTCTAKARAASGWCEATGTASSKSAAKAAAAADLLTALEGGLG
ncbi:RNB domain-containing ribonuclease [Actinomadura geliboluensis]|uniref:RNB domain-containing ribonuclease n=1 Tax=Actinomadura geliboluensis TaxID=882440 RepID=UPI0036907A08